VECKLRCVNFRRVSDPRRAFLPAFRVTGSTSDKSGSADDKPGSTWEHLGVPGTNLGAPAISLGAPRITVEQSGKTSSSLGTLLVRLEIIATTYRSTIFKTHVLSLYSHLCIYVSI
jgi:hypothetical protein